MDSDKSDQENLGMSNDSQQRPRSVQLSPADHAFAREGWHNITIAYYFEQSQDFLRLREALVGTLDKFFPLKGRLVYTDQNTLAIREDLSSPLGAAEFEDVRIDEMPAVDDCRGMLRFATSVEGRIGAPLTRIRLVQLPKGSILSVSIAHAVSDGFGYFFFLMSWAAACRGVALPEPSHNRAALDFGADGIVDSSSTSIFQRARSFLLPAERFDGEEDKLSYDELFLSSTWFDQELERAQKQFDTKFSKNDLLTAWLWKKYVALWNAPGDEVSITCAVDVRRLVEELTPLYFGNASIAAVLKSTYEDVARASVGELALKIRALVSDFDRSAVEETMRCLEQLRQQGTFSAQSRHGLRGWHPDSGLIVTNLSRLPLGQLDFGAGPAAAFYPIGAPRAAAVFAAPGGMRVLVGQSPAELAKADAASRQTR